MKGAQHKVYRWDALKGAQYILSAGLFCCFTPPQSEVSLDQTVCARRDVRIPGRPDRQTHTDRQTDRQTQADRPTYRPIYLPTYIPTCLTYLPTYTEREREKDRACLEITHMLVVI